ncbi:hypothetical protein H4R34_000651 [Dimargaris verticillata]|uniref:Long-chain fatty acid--CoA ligase n=1 Tax=Dimargaris verticillata TaxID=2761393 RepID=A0A9W8EF72_9FUNG|nr:hypothetical protein H4R34_000651 [Dimargaris verticillata]
MAIVDPTGNFTYRQLLRDVQTLRYRLSPDGMDLNEARVAFLCPNGYEYVVAQWAIWAAGGIAVPLSTLHPVQELQYFLEDAQATVLLFHPDHAATVEALPANLQARLQLMDVQQSIALASTTAAVPRDLHLSGHRRALIIYTSGTTGKPKGVVSSHCGVQNQVDCLVQAWQWSSHDRIHHALPLHHVHGVINALNCGLASGATVEFASRFRAEDVWRRWIDGPQDLTLFMGVPAMYAKLAQAYDRMPKATQVQASKACRQFRLMVSGSSALPSPLYHRWRDISGHTLLERYGMTETGMVLSNPALDASQRREGSVGYPLPGVQVCLMDDQGQTILPKPDQPGELLVKGGNLFREYWSRPEATRKAFTADGWFKTGDSACQATNGSWRILGRNSQDILKSGGYKISALDIERELLAHPLIRDVAVVGAPDQVLGQQVAAVVQVLPEHCSTVTSLSLEAWCQPRLARYQTPRRFKILTTDIPRNAMGKVSKKAMVEHFFM